MLTEAGSQAYLCHPTGLHINIFLTFHENDIILCILTFTYVYMHAQVIDFFNSCLL